MKYLGNPQSGSLAGQTASRNRYGQYLRTRAIPVNPGTAPQTDIRAILAALSSAWRGLTDGQRAAWEAAAANEPGQDSLGQTIYPSGYGYYMSCNMIAQRIGEPTMTTPPAGVAFEGGAPAPWKADVEAGPNTWSEIDITVSIEGGPVPAGVLGVLWASAPRSPGVTFDANLKLIMAADFSQIETSDDYLFANDPATVAAAYAARYGSVATPGQRIRMRLDLYSAGRRITWAAQWVPITDEG